MMPSRSLLIPVGALLCLGTLASHSNAQQPNRPEKQLRIVFENDRVLVRDFVLPPGAITGLHTHQRPELTYSFTNGELRATIPGEPLQPDRRVAGRAHWRDVGFTHDVENVGTSKYHALLIELKEPAGTPLR